VDLTRRPDAGLERSLDPGVVERGVLAGEMDPALGRHDRLLQPRLLLGLEQREGAARPWIVVPVLDGADLELGRDRRVDLGDVLERLFDRVLGVHGAPPEGILAPGVRREERASFVVRI